MIFRGSGSIWTQTLYWLAEKFRMIFKSSANKVFEYGVVQALNSPSLCFVLLPTAGEASILRTTFLIVFSIFLYSCGSFQPTSYYATDGIYSSDQQVQNTPKKQAPKSTEYSQYFNEKSKEYAWDESATDVYLSKEPSSLL